MHNLIKLLDGKQVLLIGNSSSILQQDKADFIDSHEFVIRFNLAPTNQSKYYHKIGKKIDGWFFTMVSEDKCKRVYSSAKIKPKHCIRHSDKPLNIGQNNYFVNTETYRKKFKELLKLDDGIWPSSGLCLTHYITEYCKAKSLSLIGFDSFKNHNFYTKVNNAHMRHNQIAEEEYLKKLINLDSIKVY